MIRGAMVGLLILVTTVVLGQLQPTDSLETLLLTSKDSTRVNLLNNLSVRYSKKEFKKALEYANKALKLSEETDYPMGIATSYRSLALAIFFSGEHTKSIEYFLLSATKAAAIKQWNLEAQNYLTLGGIYASVLGNYPKSMEYYLKTLDVYESHNSHDKSYDALSGVAYIYNHEKEYDKALEYYRKSLQLAEQHNDHRSIGITTQNIGNVYFAKGQTMTAQESYERSIASFRAAKNDGGMIISLVKLSDIFRQHSEFDKALKNDLEAYAKVEKSSYDRERISPLESLGKTYLAKGEYGKSKFYFEQAVAIASKAKMMENLSEDYQLLAELSMKLKDFEKAFHYQKLHTDYVDSIRSKERMNQLAEMEVRFETDRKEKENQLLKKDNDLNRIYVTMAITSLILVIVIAALFINRQRLKSAAEKALIDSGQKLLQAELDIAKLSAEQFKNDIDFKNKELTTYTLNLIQKNEILETVKSHLEQLKSVPTQEATLKLNSLINSVNFSFHLDKGWDGFRKHFEDVHEIFFETLRARQIDLNASDMKLCALLRLNLNNKEISTILGISPDSIKVARHRLRKKLQLSEDQNLDSFLGSI